jgi:hypothetical protein
MSDEKRCPVCGEPAKYGNYCSRSCAGKATGGRPAVWNKPKIAKLGKDGYLYYTRSMLDDEERLLMKDGGRTILVHRLVMAKKLGHPIGKRVVVMHINGNKLDNDLDNLMVGDAQENTRQHWEAIKENIRLREENARLLASCNKSYQKPNIKP